MILTNSNSFSPIQKKSSHTDKTIPYELHTHFPDESIIVLEEISSTAYREKA